ncbi:MAG: hypothetical protein ACRDNL_14005, partial [Spirillospora sp.]
MDGLTGTQIERFRADVNRSRTPGAYEAGRWSVAPANRDPAVTGAMPERVRLRDTSMRAIESMPGVAATREQKTAFLRLLARSGVPEIVLATPSHRGLDAVRADLELVRQEQPGCVVYCPFVSATDGVDLAHDVGFDGVQV